MCNSEMDLSRITERMNYMHVVLANPCYKHSYFTQIFISSPGQIFDSRFHILQISYRKISLIFCHYDTVFPHELYIYIYTTVD